MATGDGLKSTKAVVAAVLGFIAPGAGYLAGVSSDGVSANEWIVALCFCIGGSAVVGGSVYQFENKAKSTEL
ncbi:hypothetical protein GCM10009804_03260 [Kribbella hippodromi]|uniref:Holin n=1 Tax=Kribbella hippodromi TaxID=434347 RepID=A0ABN2BZ78_9ACTN